MDARPSTLVICCGAVAREIVAMVRENGWSHMRVECLAAHLHNSPASIPEGVRAKIRANRDRYDDIVVLYTDCGTHGALDKMLEEEGIERVLGSHCYEVYAGIEAYEELCRIEVGSFFLTDFLVRHFDRLIVKGLGLDRYPKLRLSYFKSYKKLVYLAQSENPELEAKAREAADTLGLDFEMRITGYGGFQAHLASGQGDGRNADAGERQPRGKRPRSG